MQRINHANQFVPRSVLLRTGKVNLFNEKPKQSAPFNISADRRNCSIGRINGPADRQYASADKQIFFADIRRPRSSSPKRFYKPKPVQSNMVWRPKAKPESDFFAPKSQPDSPITTVTPLDKEDDPWTYDLKKNEFTYKFKNSQTGQESLVTFSHVDPKDGPKSNVAWVINGN